jgi:exodeoxyribonuclease VII small subunit
MAKRAGGGKLEPAPEAPDLGDLPFEKALAELEEIVAALEEGSLSLEESLARFERGILLSRHLEAQLRRAEARVRRLAGEGGELADLEVAEADGGDGEGEDDPRLPF